MPKNLTQKLVAAHLVDGEAVAGAPIALRIAQATLTDATGPLAVLALEALGVDRVRTEVAAIYVDHDLVQEDPRAADTHLLLRSAAQRWGMWFSRPGNGVSHAIHLARLAVPGKTLLGADPHASAMGALGLLAMPAGGTDVALALAGEPYRLRMPKVFGIRLNGQLPDWTSARDLALVLLRRHGPSGADGCVLEFHGPGIAHLSVSDRQVLACMAPALGAIGAVFPVDDRARAFLKAEGREGDWQPHSPEARAPYDLHDEVDLGTIEPMVALPPGPGNVAAVREIAGAEIGQVVIGSAAAPGWRDLAMVARMLEGGRVHPQVSLHVDPPSRALLADLAAEGLLAALLRAGARVHEPGRHACAGLGHLPSTGGNSLRTTAWHGVGGAPAAGIFLCSPETAAAGALTGRLVDPRDLGVPYPRVEEPRKRVADPGMLEAPLPPERARTVHLRRGPGLVPPPTLDPLPDRLRLPVLLKMGDGVAAGCVLPWSARSAPMRGHPAALADYAFLGVDKGYARRAREVGDHAVVAGRAYGNGPGDEHAALSPRLVGLRAVLAISYADVHLADLANWGVLPLLFAEEADYDGLLPGDAVILEDLHAGLRAGGTIPARVGGTNRTIRLRHALLPGQLDAVLSGSRLRPTSAPVARSA